MKTEKKTSDYLHLYLPCEAFEVINGKVINKRITIKPHMLEYVLTGTCEYKPILRPLSSMTEDEAKSIHSIQFGGHPNVYTYYEFDIRRAGNGWSVIRLDCMNTKLIITDHGNLWKTIEEDNNPPHVEPMQYQNEILRFLLSKCFDLFELIPAGLAIDKNTL
jgi:hypothetical protein